MRTLDIKYTCDTKMLSNFMLKSEVQSKALYMKELLGWEIFDYEHNMEEIKNDKGEKSFINKVKISFYEPLDNTQVSDQQKKKLGNILEENFKVDNKLKEKVKKEFNKKDSFFSKIFKK